jgi:hypothetical protein
MNSIFSSRSVVTLLCTSGVAFSVSMGAQPGSAKPEQPAKQTDGSKAKTAPEPYPLSTCPISGGKLGSMGDPIVKIYEGREVRFCCNACPPKFEKDMAKNVAKLDSAIVADQLPLYPLETSVVSGKKLPAKPVDWVYSNRLVRLGDEAEKAEFMKDPAKHLASLDKAVVDKQLKDYPLTKCPVSEEELGGMGEAKNLVIGGRLVRVCCNSCIKDVRKEPAKFIAMVDEARKGAPTKKGAGEPKDAGKSEPKR